MTDDIDTTSLIGLRPHTTSRYHSCPNCGMMLAANADCPFCKGRDYAPKKKDRWVGRREG